MPSSEKAARIVADHLSIVEPLEQKLDAALLSAESLTSDLTKVNAEVISLKKERRAREMWLENY